MTGKVLSIQRVISIASQFSWLALRGLPLFFLLGEIQTNMTCHDFVLTMALLHVKAPSGWGLMTKTSCTLQGTFSNELLSK